MNIIFAFFILTAFFTACWHQLHPATGQSITSMQILTQSMLDGAGSAVTLSIQLIGVMTFFLGLMKIAEKGGLLLILAKLLRPLMHKLFPEVPTNHPAMGAMIMNIAANVLGLGSAATPFGIKAMQSLNTLNAKPGTATNAMILFLAINTSSVTLLPTGVIAIRQALGSQNPAGIIPTTLFATLISTTVAIITAKLLQRTSKDVNISPGKIKNDNAEHAHESYALWISITAILSLLFAIPLTIKYGEIIAPWIIPTITTSIVLFGICKKIKIYEVFIDGAKEGFQIAIKIMPYLVAILSAVAMLQSSGALASVTHFLGNYTQLVNLPGEALPMALLRPLSGSGAYGIMANIIQNPNIGPDSYIGYLVSTFQGSTETTFYVLAVYFGAIQIRKVRHAVLAALSADIAGIMSAVFIVHKLYG